MYTWTVGSGALLVGLFGLVLVPESLREDNNWLELSSLGLSCSRAHSLTGEKSGSYLHGENCESYSKGLTSQGRTENYTQADCSALAG